MSLFAEFGVRGATTRAIARRAHTTEGNLYRYYPSKLELARHVFATCIHEFGLFMRESLEGVVGPVARMDRFVAAYVQYAHDHPTEHTLLVEQAYRGGMSLPDGVLRPRHMLIQILEDGMKSGEFRQYEPDLILVFLGGGMARTLTPVEIGGPPIISPERTADLQRLVRQVLGVKEETPER
jgi:AcrR family transcriptional regulator